MGEWSLEQINVESRRDGFHLTLDQEEVILTVTDAAGFAGELGMKGSDPVPPDREMHVSKSLSTRLSGVDPEEQFADVKRRIEILATALTNSAVSPEDVFGRWLRLLKEINRRHGQGAMPTPTFYRLNSELLELIPAPAPTPPQQVIDSRQGIPDDPTG